MNIKELTRLASQLERELSRATKATRALERLLAESDEDGILIEGLGHERVILEKVSADIYELNRAISKVYPVRKTNPDEAIDRQMAIYEINHGLKALEGIEHGLSLGNFQIIETELWKAMQGFLRLQKMFVEEEDS